MAAQNPVRSLSFVIRLTKNKEKLVVSRCGACVYKGLERKKKRSMFMIAMKHGRLAYFSSHEYMDMAMMIEIIKTTPLHISCSVQITE